MKHARILIVEDEAVTGLYMRYTLEQAGYLVTGIETSGEEAVRKAAEDRPDLVLIDIHLTGKMDGIEAARVMRESYRIPSLFITAYLPEEVMVKYQGVLSEDIITKPIEEVLLRQRIDRILSR